MCYNYSFPKNFYLICKLRKHETTIISKLLDRGTICSGHKRRCGWRIATLPLPGCGRVPTNTREEYVVAWWRCIAVVLKKRRTCHLAAAPLIIMRRAYLPSDDGGPTWRWARCAYSYFLFRRLLTGDSTDGTSAIVPPSRRTCSASFFDDAQRERKKFVTWRIYENRDFRFCKLPIEKNDIQNVVEFFIFHLLLSRI